MTCVTWCDYAGEIRPPKDDGSKLITWEIVLATLSNYGTNELLKVFSLETPSIPTQFYVAINSTPCTRAAQGTELSGDGYGRIGMTFQRLSDIQRVNTADVFSPTASAVWGAQSFSLHDAPTGGNYWGYGNLVAEFTVDVGRAIVWRKGTASIGLGSAI